MHEHAIRLSHATRSILRGHPQPNIVMRRLLAEHQADRIMRRLTTPSDGTYAITLSLHRVWSQAGPLTVVLVQSLLTQRYLLYTTVEFKAIVRESLALRRSKSRPRVFVIQHPAVPLLTAHAGQPPEIPCLPVMKQSAVISTLPLHEKVAIGD